MRKIAVASALVGLALLTACSGSHATEAQISKAVEHYMNGAAAKLPSCESLIDHKGWYKVVNGEGCRQGDEIEATASFDCTRGDSLVYFGDKPAFWGLSDGALHQVASQGALTNDAGYRAAYKKCNAPAPSSRAASIDMAPNQRYLRDISDAHDPALSTKPVPLIGYGHEICADLDAGTTVGQVTILDSLVPDARVAVIAAAVTDLCPQNKAALTRATSRAGH